MSYPRVAPNRTSPIDPETLEEIAQPLFDVESRAQDHRRTCLLFLSVPGSQTTQDRTTTRDWRGCRVAFLPTGTESASCSIGFSKLNSPAHRYLCLRFKRHLAMPPARLKARMDSLLSFPVGLFHPLQHAGLSRRSPDCRQSTQNRRPYCDGLLRAIIPRTDGPYLWHEARTL